MTPREQILAAIRSAHVAPHPHPGTQGPWIQYTDLRQQFRATLESVGGQLLEAHDLADAARQIANLPVYQQAQQRVTCVPLAGDWNVDLDRVSDPHDLATVDLAVLPGQFAVAENAAVWVTDENVVHRAIYFIVQHLVLIVPAQQLVHNLHEAYARLRWQGPRFGCFLSGPSKTADIEQSLVIGAHGARSLHVILVESSTSGS